MCVYKPTHNLLLVFRCDIKCWNDGTKCLENVIVFCHVCRQYTPTVIIHYMGSVKQNVESLWLSKQHAQVVNACIQKQYQEGKWNTWKMSTKVLCVCDNNVHNNPLSLLGYLQFDSQQACLRRGYTYEIQMPSNCWNGQNVGIVDVFVKLWPTWSCLRGHVGTSRCRTERGCWLVGSWEGQTSPSSGDSPAERCRCTSTPAPYKRSPTHTSSSSPAAAAAAAK